MIIEYLFEKLVILLCLNLEFKSALKLASVCNNNISFVYSIFWAITNYFLIFRLQLFLIIIQNRIYRIILQNFSILLIETRKNPNRREFFKATQEDRSHPFCLTLHYTWKASCWGSADLFSSRFPLSSYSKIFYCLQDQLTPLTKEEFFAPLMNFNPSLQMQEAFNFF